MLTHSKKVAIFVVLATLGLMTAGSLLTVAACLLWNGWIAQTEPKPASGLSELPSSKLTSATNLLDRPDYDQFRVGRPISEVLEAVQWRGNLEMMVAHRGQNVTVINYGIRGGPYSSSGHSVLAIFTDDKFAKFVEWPRWPDLPIRPGDFTALIRCAEQEEIQLTELDRKLELEEKAQPTKSYDPFLTALAIRLEPQLKDMMEQATRDNARIRDQFNATRLRLGMTQKEVSAVFRAKPLDAGTIDSRSFEVYGSTAYIGLTRDLDYSNVLVLYRDDRLEGVYSGSCVPGGQDGLDSLRRPVQFGGIAIQYFTGLPPLPVKDK